MVFFHPSRVVHRILGPQSLGHKPGQKCDKKSRQKSCRVSTFRIQLKYMAMTGVLKVFLYFMFSWLFFGYPYTWFDEYNIQLLFHGFFVFFVGGFFLPDFSSGFWPDLLGPEKPVYSYCRGGEIQSTVLPGQNKQTMYYLKSYKSILGTLWYYNSQTN